MPVVSAIGVAVSARAARVEVVQGAVKAEVDKILAERISNPAEIKRRIIAARDGTR